MGKSSNQNIKIVILNPEVTEKAKDKFTKFICEQYMKALREGRFNPYEE